MYFVCVGLHTCICGYACAFTDVWNSEANFLESLFSFYM